MKKFFFLIFFSLLLFITRTYNLFWGAPFYFHPDERNIAFAISQLQFPSQMNPHFFAYGSFPLYSIFFTTLIFKMLYPIFDTFILTIEVSRMYSALFAILLVPLLFTIAKKIKDEKAGIFSLLFTLFSTGLIQYSHFGTFEMWITFFSLLLFFFCLQILNKKSKIYLFFSSVTLGILLAIKVSNLVLFPLPLLAYIFYLRKLHHSKKKNFFLFLITSITVYFIAFFLFLLLSPFVYLDFPSFANSIHYESSVALGTIDVFYTQGFHGTTPVIYQLLHVYPFLFNPLLTLLGICSFGYVLYKSWRNKQIEYFFLILFLLILFFSQALLFVKWTRYMVPTIPFMYLMIGMLFSDFFDYTKIKKKTNLFWISFVLTCSISILFSVSFFITTYLTSDTRIVATEWAKNHLPHNKTILSEPYDLGILPFQGYFPQIQFFNFYDYDSANRESNDQTLTTLIQTSDGIILPSQRIMRTRLAHPNLYPQGHRFYADLFSRKLGFILIYQTPCDIFCTIAYMGNPLLLEETADVFDRPTVFIFQKP